MPDLNADFPDASQVELDIQIDREAAPDDLNIDRVIEDSRAYLVQRRVDLMARVAKIETVLGFIEVEGELATRVAKLERFTGIKG